MIRQFYAALACAVLSSCACDVPLKCTATSDCEAGQTCVRGECRATSSNPDGGNGGAGGSGGGGTGGGSQSIVVMGCDPTAADNASKDSDCDGLSDAEEYGTNRGNGATTDPCRSDSDGDGVSDGIEVGSVQTVSSSCGALFVPDAVPSSKTNPTLADTDRDGVNDGVEDANQNGAKDPGETDPLKQDSDCDGYSDGEERSGAAGCVSDGSKADTDGDGLPDGVEGGLAPVGADPRGCTYGAGTYDIDSSVKTNACNADSDGDGIADGAEDTNLNGRADPGELNPNNNADGTGVAGQACAMSNLKPVNFHSSGPADVQLALSPDFTEVVRMKRAGSSVEAGFIFYDGTNQVAGIALSKTPAGADANAEEADGRLKITTVTGPLTQTFTTWDGYGNSVRAVYDVSAAVELKEGLNYLAQAYGMDASSLLVGASGVQHPFKVVAEYVRRSPNRAVVVIAVVPANRYSGQALFRVDDTAGGTALAQFGDYANTQCEVFSAAVNQKVDFLWVVDDSCSMESSQRAVANAGTLFGQKLAAANLDWRAAGVSTGWYPTSYDGSWRPWTSDLSVMQGWFRGSSSFGTGGDGWECGFSGVQTFMTGVGNPGPFRPDAKAHFIFLTDTFEQSTTTPAQLLTYLNQKITTQPVAHGILCPEGTYCGDDPEETPGKYHSLVRMTGGVIGNIQIFNPRTPTVQETAQQVATIDAIVTAVIGGTGTQLQRPPISATIKVAVASTRGTCNGSDVPRDRTNGWDIDPATRRLVFFGNCIPSAQGVQVAVSYKYWNDASPNADGDACGGSCVAPLICDPGQRACVCSADCGGCSRGSTCKPSTCTCEPDFQ